MTGLFTKQSLGDYYLEVIAKYDKKIEQQKQRLKKYGNNKASTNSLLYTIKVLEGKRDGVRKQLAEWKQEDEKYSINQTLKKCTYCEDGIEKSDLVIHNNNNYHSWCKPKEIS